MKHGLPSFGSRAIIVLLFIACFLPGQSFAAELNLAPACNTASASPSFLWPVNHKFINIGITGITDPNNDPLSISVQCILQDEELDATGDGNFIYDAEGINTPTAAIRSERSGNNNGRVYHIDFIATDSSGARCGGEVTVSVPHDRNTPAIDEGRLFQSVPSDNICGLHDINNEPRIYSEPVLIGATYEVYQYDVDGHDPDQDVLSYSIISGPSGLVIDQVSGLLIWTSPKAGIYSVTVGIDDGRGGIDEQSYQLFINAPPEISSTPSLLHQVGSAYQYKVVATDPNNDPLNHDLLDAPQGMLIDPTTGFISWDSPSPGQYSVGLMVTDGRGGSDTQNWNLFVNGPPVITSTPITNHQVGSIFQYQIIATDPNNDVLTFQLLNPPPGMNIDIGSGHISWAEPIAGDFPLSIQVTDGHGGSDQQDFVLFVNGPPVIISSPLTEQQANTPYSYQIVAEDPNNDTLLFKLVTFPPGMIVNPETGLITWEVPAPGIYEVSVQIDDGRSGSDTQSWSLFINGPPVITSTPVAELLEGNSYGYQVVAVDPNEDTLNFTLNEGPDGLTIDAANGLVNWISPTPGDYTVSILVSDNRGGSDEQVYTLSIIPIPTVTLSAGADEIKSGESTTLTWSSTDADILSIEPGIGIVEQSGIKSVAPTKTTTYTITATGQGGSTTASVIITVTAPAIDLVPVFPGIEDATCPDSVDLVVQLQNIGGSIVEPGIPVTFYIGNPLNGGTPIGTINSVNVLDPGASETVSLHWNQPPVGSTTIYIRVDDIGNGEGLIDEANEGNNLASIDFSVCEEVQPPGAKSISGEVIDAVTGERLSNVVVNLYTSKWGIDLYAKITSVRTNYEGKFIFTNVNPIPSYASGTDFTITATAPGYTDDKRSLYLPKNGRKENQDLVLSPVLEEDEIRIVLTWGSTPYDLEAHLTGPNPEGCRNHCFYWNKEIPGATLDLDDRHSYGPETITITEPSSGTYRYYVHNFSNRDSLSNYYLSYYGAEVKVYQAGMAEPIIFKTPESRYTQGTVWHVFDIDGDTGEIYPINKFTHQVESGQIDFPRITSIPGYSPITHWGEHYTYQVEVEDPDDDILMYTLLEGPEGMSIDPETGLLEWIPTGIPDYQYQVTIKVSDGRCGEDTQSYTLKVFSTPYASLSASPCSAYNENGDITLSWDTSFAKTVLIDQGIGEVGASGSITISSPEFPQVYTLTAFNDVETTVARIPAAEPDASLYFSPNLIEPIHTSQLNWNCGCAATCEIDQGIGKVSGTGSMSVSPLETTTYTITASNAVGTTSYQKTLTVQLPEPPPPPVPPAIPAPYVYYFTGAPDCDWSPGDPITLGWSSRNATTCEITPDIGQVNCYGSTVVNPDKAGTYTFTARSDGGIHSRNFTFPQNPSGTLWATIANPNSTASIHYTYPGEIIYLHWTSTCADSVSISGVGEVGSMGYTPVIVPDVLPHTYTMTAANAGGSTFSSVTLYSLQPTANFTTEDSILKVGESTVLQWASHHAAKCTITPDIGEVGCNGTVTVTPDKPTTYTLKLEGAGGTASYSLNISFVPPDVDIQATPDTINEGESSTLSWVFSNATTCSIDQGVGEIQLGKSLSVSPLVTTTYTITAVGPGGTRTDQVTVDVIPVNLPPTATISVDPDLIWNGDEAILTWSTQYADTLSITPDIGTVTSSSGSQTITPEQDMTYTITATGVGGTATAQVRIFVQQHIPKVNLTAAPESIDFGSTTILTWNSEYADTVIISPDIGQVGASGSLEVSPAESTTYTVTATGPGGSVNESATVTVVFPLPTASLIVEPGSIAKGESVQLMWSSENADSCSITPIIGAVECNGSQTVTPDDTTTYTFTATGPGGSISSSATVDVIHPVPTITAYADPSTIQPGESAILSWTSTNAEYVTIEPDIGTQPANGQVTVTPDATTNYTITATGQGGDVSTAVQIVVLDGSLEIIILEPMDQEIVPSGKVFVHGRLTTDASYANVSINGRRAVVENKEFFINDLEVPPGNFEIKVRASDSDRNLSEKIINVLVDANTTSVKLTVGDPIGILPFNTSLKTVLTEGEILADSATINTAGPSDVTISKINDSEFSLGFTVPGLYTLSYSATDTSSNLLTAQCMITVRKPISDEEWQAMTSSVAQLENLFLSQLGAIDIDTLRQQVVELARANADFSSVKLSYDDLCLIYKGRIPVILDLRDPYSSKPKE